MVPISQFRDASLGGITSFGHNYECSQCGAQVDIRAGSSLVSGGFIGLIAAIIGWWALNSGPIWYATHLSYFSIEDYRFSMMALDLLAILFYSFVAIFAAWLVWIEFVQPVKTRLLHRTTGENRAKSKAENTAQSKSRKKTLASFFIFPFLVYIPLIAGIWLLDAGGIDIRGNELYKFLAITGVFAGAMLLAKRFRIEFSLVFFGMVFWMAILVTAIFTIR